MADLQRTNAVQSDLLRLHKDMGDGTHAPVVVAGSLVSSATATIPADATGLSAAVDLGNARAARIAMPAAWTAAALTFQASYDGVTYNNLYDRDGLEYTVQAAASRSIILPLADFAGIQFLKVRSGPGAAAVQQAAQRSLVIQTVV